MALPKEKTYTIEDIYALPEGQRAELLDGRLYDMAPPNRIHQKLVNRLSQITTNYIDAKHGSCEVYPAPFAVFLTSPSDPGRDYNIKLFKYHTAGVREYWIVNPQKNVVSVFDFEKEQRSNQYNLNDDIPVCIYGDFIINIDKLLR